MCDFNVAHQKCAFNGGICHKLHSLSRVLFTSSVLIKKTIISYKSDHHSIQNTANKTHTFLLCLSDCIKIRRCTMFACRFKKKDHNRRGLVNNLVICVELFLQTTCSVLYFEY